MLANMSGPRSKADTPQKLGTEIAMSRCCAPHIDVWIVARGINIGLNTRLYFSDDGAANSSDPVLHPIEQPVSPSTLIAKRNGHGGKVIYSFTINLQGPDETVFFDV